MARASADGSVEAFTELVRRHEHRVRSFLSRLCRGEGADDLAQEAFLIAWRKAGSYRGEGSYRGWLLRIAWRCFLAAHRTRVHAQSADPDIEQASGGAPDLAIDIDRALARLNSRERAAALLCFGEGCSHREAADILAMPLGTLKSVVARARAELVAMLGDER